MSCELVRAVSTLSDSALKTSTKHQSISGRGPSPSGSDRSNQKPQPSEQPSTVPHGTEASVLRRQRHDHDLAASFSRTQHTCHRDQLSILKQTSPKHLSSQQHPHQHQLLRHYGYATPKEKFLMPPGVQAIVDDAIAAHAKIPVPHISPPKPSPMLPDSHRVGCIAIKAGMTQEWDEHGVRVPLTVLWVDECEVSVGGFGFYVCVTVQCGWNLMHLTKHTPINLVSLSDDDTQPIRCC